MIERGSSWPIKDATFSEKGSFLVSSQVPLRMHRLTSTSWYNRRLCDWTIGSWRGKSSQKEQLQEYTTQLRFLAGWFQGKTVLWKIVEGRAGEWPAGKGKKLTHPTMCQHCARGYQSSLFENSQLHCEEVSLPVFYSIPSQGRPSRAILPFNSLYHEQGQVQPPQSKRKYTVSQVQSILGYQLVGFSSSQRTMNCPHCPFSVSLST